MNKRLRREHARECQVHIACYNEAFKRLERDGIFSIQQVLEATRYTAIAQAIRWDYIVEFIKEDHRLDGLTPLSQAYFTPHKKEDELVNPGRYVAYGGLTGGAVGYALVTERNRHLVIARLRQRHNILSGAARQFEGCLKDARNRLGSDELNVLSLPRVRDDAAA